MQLFSKKTLFLVLMTAFLDLLGVGILIPVLPEILRHVGLSGEWAGYSQAIYAFSTFAIGFLAGKYSDRLGRKPVILITTLANGIGAILLALSLSSILPLAFAWMLFLASRLISGVSGAGFGVIQAMMSDIAPREERAKYFGMMGATFGLAFLLGPMIGGLLALHSGISAIAYALIALVIGNIIAIYLLLPETRSLSSGGTTLSLASLTRDKSLLLLLGISLGTTFAFSILTSLSSQYYSDRFHLDATHIAAIFSIVGLTSIVYQGFLIGHIRRWMTEKTLFIVSLFVLFATFLLFSLASQVWMIYLIVLIIPCAIGSINPLIGVFLTRGRTSHTGAVMGVNASVTGFAQILGPLLGALFYSVSYGLPFLFASGVFLCVCILFLAI